MIHSVVTASEADTVAAGAALGRSLRAGDTVLLTGPLGAGKTAFVRGLAEGLGCAPGAVSSPTFTIAQEYAGTTTLQHVDLYRLTPVEVDDLGLDELREGAALAVEWPDRWSDAPADAIRVAIEPAGDDLRRLTIERPDYSTR